MVNLDYLYNPEIAKPYFERNRFIDKKLGFQVIEKGTILPHKDRVVDGKWTWGKGGIIDSNGNFIKSSHVSATIDRKNSIYTPPPESIQHSSETVIYLTIFFPVWGHVISDNVRRLWFLNNDTLRKEFKNCPIVYIPWDNKENYYINHMPDASRLLEILGVDSDRLRPITQPTQFDKIILFDGAFNSGEYVTNEYHEMIDRVKNFALKNRTPTSSKKLYFFYGKNQVGEERLAEYLKSKGYEIITHEKRANFDEEINLLINAESFVSPLGSCGLNSQFLRDGTEAIFIPRSYNAFINYQLLINQAFSLNANYVDSTLSVFNVRHDSFCFIISEQLKRFFGDKFDGYEEGDFKAFLDYVNSYSIRKGRAINLFELKGYGTVFQDFITQLKQHKDLIATYNMPSDWDIFRPPLNYCTRIPMREWWRNCWKAENQFSNPLDRKLEVLGIAIKYLGHKIYYSVYFNEKEGWSQEGMAPDMVGTKDKSKPIMGMRIRFDEAGAKEFDILYRMHKFDDTWTPWAKNGEELYSNGIKVNAIQIKLEPVKPAEVAMKFDELQTFLTEGDEIHLQGQRQDLTQIKLT